MRRELTPRPTGTDSGVGRLEIEVSRVDSVVRVALSGILDEAGLERVIGRVAPMLTGRGQRVILDGSRLVHMDYRSTRSLIRWNRNLRRFSHTLHLGGWNDYLRAILCMEDWERELGLPLVPAASPARGGGLRQADS
ncbi:hypothetical protein CSA17_05050 [bacterium DOLJORAL78_65_58]|nr:MAG: hypothetical protein CSB20_02515 [bacterium DOLZORAL124_64_63]PIE75903.1 MAG: hypothetical protein CSA17_05050 [bacterium DOLJORAL78_65_58]